jgi:hypothetical protein
LLDCRAASLASLFGEVAPRELEQPSSRLAKDAGRGIRQLVEMVGRHQERPNEGRVDVNHKLLSTETSA